ncbi:Heterokaryon incompatibility protein 6, OR allele [Colletotrichum siamense]|nr:Heterokaryon incompatibility protein 6, OR allele [Colletotrichum siamense]
MTELFKYSPLDLAGRSFRLLMLHQGTAGEISCDIFEASLEPDSAMPYEAVSYAWGTTDQSETITANGKILHVTKNLYSALEHLRHKENRILWIDAICIDQTNLQERGHQVGQMSDIYRQADQVLVWLGPSTYETKVLMESLGKLQRSVSKPADWTNTDLLGRQWLEVEQKNYLDYAALTDIQRCGLTSLLHQPWFNRIWIIQEVANARASTICCGQHSIRSHVFAAAPGLLGLDPDPHRQAVLDLMPSPSRKAYTQKKHLHTLLRSFRQSQATDPRDMVYALLGISDLGSDIVPDYNKPEVQVVHELQSLLFFGAEFARNLGQFAAMRHFLLELPTLTDNAFKTLIVRGRLDEVEELLRRGETFCITEMTASLTRVEAEDMMQKLLELNHPNLTFSPGCFDYMFGWCSTETASLILNRAGEDLRIITSGMAFAMSGGAEGTEERGGISALMTTWASTRTISVTQKGFETFAGMGNMTAVRRILEFANKSYRVTVDMLDIMQRQAPDPTKRCEILECLLTQNDGIITVDEDAIVWIIGIEDEKIAGFLLRHIPSQSTPQIAADLVDDVSFQMVLNDEWEHTTGQEMAVKITKTVLDWDQRGVLKFTPP